MTKQKIGWGFKLEPDLDEAFNYSKENYKTPDLPGALFWYTDENGKTWLWRGLLTIPYQVNYKLNEEIDSASIRLISKLDEEMPISHKIPNMVKCKLLHEVNYDIKSKEELLTYDEYGRPLNHNDFYIAGGMCKFTGSDGGTSDNPKKLGRYEHNYDLAEPIYITRYVMCENRTFTNMTSITVTDAATGTAKTYTQEPTNLLYCLENLLKTTGVKTSKEDTTWFSKIKIMDKELLRNSAIGCSINFNTASLYDNLFKIGQYIKRLPVLYFNKEFNPRLESSLWHEEYEDYREFLLFFEKYDGSDMPAITSEEFYENSTGYMESQRAFKDAGVITSDMQNTINSDSVWYPGRGLWANLTGNESEIDVSNSKDLNIKLPFRINVIKEVRCLYSLDGSTSNDLVNIDGMIVVPTIEKKEYIQLSSSERKKYFYYEKGNNIIYVDSLDDIVKAEALRRNYNSLKKKFAVFAVNYVPTYCSKPKMTKGNNLLETSISQLDTMVESKLWGKYLENYAEENGAIDITSGKIFKKFSDIWMPGTRIVDEDKNDEYIISTATIQRYNGFYLASFDANKNVIKRSDLVTTDSRQDNKIIDSTKAQTRMSNISENNIIISLSVESPVQSEIFLRYIGLNRECIYNGLINNKILDDKLVSKFSYKDGTSKYFALPVIRSICGSSIVFTITSKDNQWLSINSQIDLKYNVSSQKFSKYTDYFGKIDSIELKLVYSNDSETYFDKEFFNVKKLVDDTIDYETNRLNFVKQINQYPEIDNTTYDEISDRCIFVDGYKYLKDTNEQMNLSLQFSFKEKDANTFFNDKLLDYLLVTSNKNVQLYALSIDSHFKVSKGDIISSSKCYHPKCEVIVEEIPKITIDNSTSEQFKAKNGWQIGLGILRDDGNFDILIASKIEGFSDTLTQITEFYLNITSED